MITNRREYGNPETLAHDKSRHPGFHKTESIDFAVVLEGEVWALMDVGEALMRSGDTLIQRGTATQSALEPALQNEAVADRLNMSLSFL